MRGAPHTVPPGFAELVARRADDMWTDLYRATGDARLATGLCDRLLRATAAHWYVLDLLRRLRRPDPAAAYLDRMLRQEVESWRSGDGDRRPPSPLELVPAGWTPYGASVARPATVPAPPADAAMMTEVAWREGRRLRLRRRWIAAGVALVALLVLGTHGGRQGAQRDGAEVTPIPVPAGVVVLPDQRALRRLPYQPTPLPRLIDLDRWRLGTPLGHGPAVHPVALVQVNPEQTYLLAADGVVHPIPVEATTTMMSNPPLLATAVSPDGVHVAFPGVGAVTVVDLSTGRSDRYAAFGSQTAAVWRTADRLQVASPSGVSAEVTLPGGRVGMLPYQTADVLACQAVCSDVYELRPPQGPDQPNSRLVHWMGRGSSELALRAAPGTGLDASWISTWDGQGIRDGDLGVRVAPTLPVVFTGAGTAVFAIAAIDLDRALVRHVLLATDRNGYGRPPVLLGFLGHDTVLLRADETLFTWRPSDGTLRLVSALSWGSAVAVVHPSGW